MGVFDSVPGADDIGPEQCDAHGLPRRECAPCLSRWVDDLLDTQHWHNLATKDLRQEVERLLRLLKEHGIEEPPPRVRPPSDRRPPKPPSSG